MRLLTAVFTAVLLAAPVSVETQRPAADTSSWPQFRGNPRLTGVTTTTLRPQLELAWTYEAGESIESSAAIVDGTVYVGSQSGELHAVELATGKLRWKYKAAEAIGESSPAVAGGVVYIGDLSGVVHAVNAADGKALWTFKTEMEIKSSPVVVDGKVLIGSYDESLYALDARSGKLTWKATTNGPVHATAAVAGGITYISGCDGHFRAIRITDGVEQHVVKVGTYTAASPALEGNWAWFGTFDNNVLAVDMAAQKVMWSYTHPERNFPFYSSAAVANGKVVLGGRDRMVHALDAKTGKALWTFMTRARVDSSPAIAGGRVYIGSGDGRLYVLDLETGEKVWEFNAGAPLTASPAIAQGYVVIGSNDGQLYAFR